MGVLLVGTGDEVGHCGDLAIGEDAQFEPDRTGKAARRPGGPDHHLFRGQLDPAAAEQTTELDVVQLPVAAQQHRHRLALVGLHDQGLDQALGGNLQKEGHLLNRFAGRGQHLFELLRGSRRRDRDGFDFRLLHIGRVLAAVAGDDGVLARFGQHHEFMGVGAADGTGLGHRSN